MLCGKEKRNANRRQVLCLAQETSRRLPFITTPSSAASPYSSFVPNLITHQAFAQELWKT
jgi:hypothetical protein